MIDLYKHSIEIILQNQSSTGAYIASPSFPSYQYCWFRDGAFIAHAMDGAGQVSSAERFHDWAAAAILRRQALVHRAVRRRLDGLPLDEADVLHTRYTLDGEDGSDEAWPNFQLDGFGTWLWALEKHIRRRQTGDPDFAPKAEWLAAAELLAEYLLHLWAIPCYDCWEEFPDKIHTYTLAAIYGGLSAIRSRLARCAGPAEEAAQAIRTYLLENLVEEGKAVKFLGTRWVDASLIGLTTPYQLLAVEDSVMRATVQAIEASLRRGGGVHRYPGDTYYGGGEWVLLTAWLGWYYTEIGEWHKASALCAWVEAQVDEDGCLPEQVHRNLNDPNYLAPWEQRWGPAAVPLLWSHAKYLILRDRLDGRGA